MAAREIERPDARLSINRMTEHDLLEVVEIEELSALSIWGWDAYHKELQSPADVIMLVARAGEAIESNGDYKLVAGFIVTRLVAGELHVNNVAVRPEFRRRGIAKQLLTAVLREGQDHGARVAFLEVREGNRTAQGLYQGCGFQIAGRRKRYYQQPVEDALLMTLLLETSP